MKSYKLTLSFQDMLFIDSFVCQIFHHTLNRLTSFKCQASTAKCAKTAKVNGSNYFLATVTVTETKYKQQMMTWLAGWLIDS